MKAIEVNRMIEVWEEDKRVSPSIADGLSYVVGNGSKCDETAESEQFRENMLKYFPDPIARAKILKQLALSACVEESDEEEEIDDSETNFFLSEMLKAINQAIEVSESLDECQTIITQLLNE